MTAALQTGRTASGLILVRFAPAALGVYAGPSPDGAPGHTAPARAARALAASGAGAVLDGGMFSRCDEAALSGSDAQRYAQSRCAAPHYGMFDARAGVRVPSPRPRDGGTLAVLGDRSAVALDGWAVPPGARVAVQGYPTLVRAGSVVAFDVGENAEAVWRAGFAVFDDGQVGFVLGAMDMVAFGGALRDAGAVDAWYTDGGGSARIALADGTHYGAGEDRPVAAWITAGAAGGGAGGVVGAGLGAGLLAYGFRVWTGRWPWQRR